MAVLEMGRQPDLLQIILTEGSAFHVALQSTEAEPFVEAPLLRFQAGSDPDAVADIDWVSTLTLPYEATWAVPSDQVDTLLSTAFSNSVQLVYSDQVWAEGHFEVTKA